MLTGTITKIPEKAARAHKKETLTESAIMSRYKEGHPILWINLKFNLLKPMILIRTIPYSLMNSMLIPEESLFRFPRQIPIPVISLFSIGLPKIEIQVQI